MGKPDNPEAYVAIQLGEWARRYGVLYVAWEIWERLRPAASDFTFYVQEGGRCRIYFDRPLGKLKVQRDP